MSISTNLGRRAVVAFVAGTVAVGCGPSDPSGEGPIAGTATSSETTGTTPTSEDATVDTSEAARDATQPVADTSEAAGDALEPTVDTSEASGDAIEPVGRADIASGTTLFLPSSAQPATPMIVLVPGGGWVAADPSGLVPLAEALAGSGAVAATITYRTASDDTYFPEPAQDIACRVSEAVEAATGAGFPPSEVVLTGHSAGAQLAALVALRPEEFAAGCDTPAVIPDRLVGLAGPYDVARASGPAQDLFGPDNDDPAAWSEGNPVDHAAARPELEVLLVHGAADGTVPIVFTEQFADELLAGGHVVDTTYPASVDHHDVYSAPVAGPLIIEWLGLGSSTSRE